MALFSVNGTHPLYTKEMQRIHVIYSQYAWASQEEQSKLFTIVFTEEYIAVLTFLFRLTKNKGNVCFSGV